MGSQIASSLTPLDCTICYGLDVENAFFRRERLRKVRRTVKLCGKGDILNSALDGCPGCVLISKGIQVSAVSNMALVHIIFEVGFPLRVEGDNIDVEFYVNPGIHGLYIAAIDSAAHGRQPIPWPLWWVTLPMSQKFSIQNKLHTLQDNGSTGVRKSMKRVENIRY
jgi:hypothetical protein